jgi:hypothetical protein
MKFHPCGYAREGVEVADALVEEGPQPSVREVGALYPKAEYSYLKEGAYAIGRLGHGVLSGCSKAEYSDLKEGCSGWLMVFSDLKTRGARVKK